MALEFENRGILVERMSELPDFRRAKKLYMDFETTSGVDAEGALSPYDGKSKICGVCVTADDCPNAYYLPLRHRNSLFNLMPEPAMRWVADCIETCGEWVNHNVKFDMHFAAAEGVDLSKISVVCTLMGAKLVDSDRGFGTTGYGLDELSKDWLQHDISKYGEKLWSFLNGVRLPNRKSAKDFGLVPADVLGEYGCQDVLTNRDLHLHEESRIDEQQRGVWETEKKITCVLFDIEREGMRVDPQQLQMKELELLVHMATFEEWLHRTVGFAVAPHTNEGCYQVLCQHYGLPVLAWTDGRKNEKGEWVRDPSFDKTALTSYLGHPDVVSNPLLLELVTRLREYRKRNTLLTFFVRPYMKHQRGGIMHPDYNQAVRTGRFSCKRPNAQQLSKDAKELILPDPGCAFLSCDYSQVEFRLIVHYIRDPGAILAFAKDPDTDFHTWVAQMCEIDRKPAKNVNFCVGFAGGKKKVVSMLSGDMSLMTAVAPRLDKMIEMGVLDPRDRQKQFAQFCEKRGEEVYDKYHATLPNLKRTTWTCAKVAKERGYVFNAYGRQRRMPSKAAWRAFNAIVQSSAADLMKERTVSLAPRYCPEVRQLGMSIRASVHDETKFHGPKETCRDPRVVNAIVSRLEDTAVKFLVPIRCKAGWSDQNWKVASSDAADFKNEYFRSVEPAF